MMNIILGKRGSGKTTKLVEDCIANNGVIITAGDLDIIKNIAKEKGANIEVIQFKDYDKLKFKIAGLNKKLYFDEMESILSKMFRQDIGEIVFSVEE